MLGRRTGPAGQPLRKRCVPQPASRAPRVVAGGWWLDSSLIQHPATQPPSLSTQPYMRDTM